MRLMHLVLAALLMGCAAQNSASDASAPSVDVVQTENGAVRGVIEGDVLSFKGLPFAAPPVGDLRWRVPQPAASWSGVHDANAFGADCMQLPFPQDSAPVRVPVSEDCLYLNIWRPAERAENEELPVMVWIYGGGLVIGGTSPLVYDGSEFARDDVVFVSINYRIGRFGFFAHPALTAAHPNEVTGNFGYADQIAALQWIERNIAAFGGDPENVTIFGESAGGGSVAVLMSSPLSRGLFDRAILQSAGLPGGRSGALGMRALSGAGESGEAMGVQYAESIGIEGTGPEALQALRALPASVLQEGVGFFGPPALGVPGPMVDGRLIVSNFEAALASGNIARVPVMVGANDLDIGFGPAQDKDQLFATFSADAARARSIYDPTGNADFRMLAQWVYADMLMVEPARHIADEVSRLGLPAHHYRFAYAAESIRSMIPGAVHASEIPYIFKTVPAALGGAQTAADLALSQQAHDYWVAFAKTGDPNGAGRPAWPAYRGEDGAMLQFGNEGVTVGADPWEARLDFIEEWAERSAAQVQ